MRRTRFGIGLLVAWILASTLLGILGAYVLSHYYLFSRLTYRNLVIVSLDGQRFAELLGLLGALFASAPLARMHERFRPVLAWVVTSVAVAAALLRLAGISPGFRTTTSIGAAYWETR
jgi:hypothetical protein